MDAAVRVHESPGRFRVRILERRGDDAFFERVAAALRELPAVRAVQTSARTGSVVIRYAGARSSVERFARQRDLFEVRPGPGPTSADLIWRQIRAVNRGFSSRDPELKLNAVLFYGLVGSALLQVARGNFLPAGEALLLQGMKILLKAESDLHAREYGDDAVDGERRER